jgi:hypothetical protein
VKGVEPRAYASEADLVREFLERLNDRYEGGKRWTVYAETAGWDLLLVHNERGFQVGLEAKLVLNAKVIEQALKDQHSIWRTAGPDYRGILVPAIGRQHHLGRICEAIGLGVITLHDLPPGHWTSLGLPHDGDWPNWCPAERCALPDYIPDVEAGHSSPIQLTPWKIKAIRLMILLDRQGFVTRADMAALQISPSRWTDAYHGFLARDPGRGGYVRCDATPDLRAQHPTNYAEIEADFDTWGRVIAPGLFVGPPPGLFDGALS